MKLIDNLLLRDLQQRAVASPRKRMNHNLHEAPADPVQRMLNAFEPETYVRPHRHSGEDRWELFLLLQGSLSLLTFADNGTVLSRIDMSMDGPVRGVEFPGNTWHTLVSTTPNSVIFEVKRGPYIANTEADFAQWAPREGAPGCGQILTWYRSAQAGDTPPGIE